MNGFVLSDVGVVRSENQDLAAIFKNKKGVMFAILCDGMGGHMGGSYASKIAISTFEKEFYKNFPSKTNLDNINSWFKTSIIKSKKEMTNFAKKDRPLLDMGTTLTATVILEDEIIVYNIGDSRTYIYNGLLEQITKDHNLRNFFIKNHGYTEEHAATLMGATALTYALGPKKKMMIDTYRVERDDSIKFIILTSDGIHDYISKPNFEKIIMANESIELKAEVLIKQAIKGKSADNLTVAIVEVA